LTPIKGGTGADPNPDLISAAWNRGASLQSVLRKGFPAPQARGATSRDSNSCIALRHDAAPFLDHAY
jgi:hypothetical protein